MTSLSLKDVSKSYGPVEVLRNIDLEIEEGELIVFVGPSGCGKSTLLRMIAGLEKITGGTLEIDGTVVNDVPPAQRGIAMVFQSYALYPHMTVYDNMAFALRLAHKSKDEIDKAVRSAADTLQLTHLLDRLPKALSGGQRQRVAIARALLRESPVLLLDEATSALDAQSEKVVQQALDRLSGGRTTLVIAHRLSTIRDADKIVVMDRGRVVDEGRHEDLLARGGIYADLHRLQFQDTPT